METYQEFSKVVTLPEFPVPVILTRTNAGEGEQGTSDTVDQMRVDILNDQSSPQIWNATKGATIAAPDSQLEHARAIFNWIVGRVRFRQDDPTIRRWLGLDNELDLLSTPSAIVSMRRPAEDCDGFTSLACAMLLCAGIPCEIVTIKAEHDRPEEWSHVYAVAYPDDADPVTMDCSMGAKRGLPFGWEAPEYFERRGWGVMRPPRSPGLHGLGDTVCDIFGCYPGADSAPVPIAGPVSTGPSLDWNGIIQSSFKLASQIALKPGQYVQTAQGVMSNQVPGAIPGQYPGVGVNVGGLSSGTLLLGGGALLLVLLIASKR